ncbi:hypothetical protein B0H10DRAFT_1903595, partial [Mycena sp. CBHHK59/15]
MSCVHFPNYAFSKYTLADTQSEVSISLPEPLRDFSPNKVCDEVVSKFHCKIVDLEAVRSNNTHARKGVHNNVDVGRVYAWVGYAPNVYSCDMLPSKTAKLQIRKESQAHRARCPPPNAPLPAPGSDRARSSAGRSAWTAAASQPTRKTGKRISETISHISRTAVHTRAGFAGVGEAAFSFSV